MKYRQSWLARSLATLLAGCVDSMEAHISYFQAGEEMLVRYPRIREPTNLLTSILGLRFRVASLHMRVRNKILFIDRDQHSPFSFIGQRSESQMHRHAPDSLLEEQRDHFRGQEAAKVACA